MFIKLTSVQQNINGDIIINKDAIVSVFKTIITRDTGDCEEVTLVYGGQIGNWEVLETPEQIYKLLS